MPLIFFPAITFSFEVITQTGEAGNRASPGWGATTVGGRRVCVCVCVSGEFTYRRSPSENFYQQIKQGGTTPRTRYASANLPHLSTVSLLISPPLVFPSESPPTPTPPWAHTHLQTHTHTHTWPTTPLPPRHCERRAGLAMCCRVILREGNSAPHKDPAIISSQRQVHLTPPTHSHTPSSPTHTHTHTHSPPAIRLHLHTYTVTT